jgi:hypothetical protein
MPIIPLERIASRIYLIRGEKVMDDRDLAGLYGVSTSALNQQVKRNSARFPGDFAFQLTSEEVDALLSQIVTAKTGRGGPRNLPWAFTEQGVAMLSSVVRSERAAHINVAIMRTFVKLRELLATNRDMAARWRNTTGRLRFSSTPFKSCLPCRRPRRRTGSGFLRGRTRTDTRVLISQFVTSNSRRGR